MFALKGFEGTSIKEICREAKVNVAAVHYHFDSKANLYKAVIARFGGSSFDAAVRALQPVTTHEELKTRLSIFLTEVLQAITEQPKLAFTIARDSQAHAELLLDIVQNTFGHMQRGLGEFIEAAKKNGLIDPSVSTVSGVLGLQAHIHFLVTNIHGLKLQYGFDLNKADHRRAWIETALNLYLHGVTRRS